MKLLISLLISFAYAGPPLKANIQKEPMRTSFGDEFTLQELRVKSGEPRYKIVVIDTGYDISRATYPAKLCKTGHYDYTTDTPNINFSSEHGTIVISALAERLKDVDYCVVVFTIGHYVGKQNLVMEDIVDAIYRAADLYPTAINISAASKPDLNAFNEDEMNALRYTNTNFTPVFVAAGNDGKVLTNDDCPVYPACYHISNVIVVGSQDPEDPKQPDKRSNRGPVVQVYGPGTSIAKDGTLWTGNSFASPRALAEYVLFLEHKRHQK